MTKKKAGKILMLSAIPHFFFFWVPVACIVENPVTGRLPMYMLWWMFGILIQACIGFFMMENLTPKDTWKSIVDFINE